MLINLLLRVYEPSVLFVVVNLKFGIGSLPSKAFSFHSLKISFSFVSVNCIKIKICLGANIEKRFEYIKLVNIF